MPWEREPSYVGSREPIDARDPAYVAWRLQVTDRTLRRWREQGYAPRWEQLPDGRIRYHADDVLRLWLQRGCPVERQTEFDPATDPTPEQAREALQKLAPAFTGKSMPAMPATAGRALPYSTIKKYAARNAEAGKSKLE